MIWMLLLLSFSMSLQANPWDWWQEYRGVQSFKQDHYDQSLKQFQKLLDDYPYDATYNYNAGEVLYRKNKFDQAKESFLRASKNTLKSSLQQQSLFNAGNCAVALKNLQEAIDLYEQVLKINSENKEAKHNLEVVKKMLEQQQQQENQQQQDQKNNDDCSCEDKKDQKSCSDDKNSNEKNQQKNDDQSDKQEEQSDQQKQSDSTNSQGADSNRDEHSDQSKQDEKQQDANQGEKKDQQDFDHDSKQEKLKDQQEQALNEQQNNQQESQSGQEEDGREQQQEKSDMQHDQDDTQSKGSEKFDKQLAPAKLEKAHEDERLSESDAYLMKLLEDYEEKFQKKAIKNKVNVTMPGQYGQKNW